MKLPRTPKLDERREPQFFAELQERARAWISEWGVADGQGDFGRALLQIAARFNSEVAERLDQAGEKLRRGFLDWLAVRGEAARPARVPVVFKLVDTAQEGVLATPPVRLQADVAGSSVVFETENSVRVVPGRLDQVIALDADKDSFYVPPPGLGDLTPLKPLPTEWRLKSFASLGATALQLDPEAGLAPETIIEAAGQRYKIVKVDADLVTIEPKLAVELPEGTTVSKVTTFAPFDDKTRSQQEHALYLGDSDLLNIEAEATIEVIGAAELSTGVTWEYWGKENKENDEVTVSTNENGEKDDEAKWRTLTPEKSGNAVVLTKPKGAIEELPIDGKKCRWIRAMCKELEVQDRTFSVDSLRVRVNCLGGDMPCPPAEPEAASPTAEAMANNTPLVLSEPFYPLGREPRQFDAFYLGCKEAFSKKKAEAQICFEMSDATCQAYAVVRAGRFANKVLAGVGKDRALHLFSLNAGVLTRLRGPLRPPRPVEPGADPDTSASLDLNPRCRPVIWNIAANSDDFYIAVAAGGEIWVWHENADEQTPSGWKRHSIVPDLPDEPAIIEDIVVLRSVPDSPGAVLSSGRFWVFNQSSRVWRRPLVPPPSLPNEPATPLRDYAALAVVRDSQGAPTDSMVAVSTMGRLYRLEIDGKESLPVPDVTVDFVRFGRDLPMGIRPAAIDNGALLVVAVGNGRRELIAVKQSGDVWNTPQRVALRAGTAAIGVEVKTSKVAEEEKVQFSIGMKTAGGDAFIASWVPTFVTTDPTTLLESAITNAPGLMGGTSLVVGDYVAVPGGHGDAFVASFNPSQRLEFRNKVIGEGVILPAPAPFALDDIISVMTNGAATPRKEWKVTKVHSERESEVIYVVDPALGEFVAEDPQLIGYRATDFHTGTIRSQFVFHPNAADPAIRAGMILRITVDTFPTRYFEVESVNLNTSDVTVKGTFSLGTNGMQLTYCHPTTSVSRVVPAIEFQPAGDGNWNASILDTAKLYFPVTPTQQVPQPSPQYGIAFGVTGNHPTVVALTQRWTHAAPPLNLPSPVIIDNVIGTWRHALSDTTSNPALSWEYWNGKGWWSLDILSDGTDRLAATGALKFTVPADIAESDWAGKVNFWIRARLVGGDYGREEVKVITRPTGNQNETEQIIERSTENIRAPQVLDLHISYSICDERYPNYVLTADSGTFRNQSDANRTAGALVEAFVPLAVMLGRLSQSGASPEAQEQCPPECDCAARQAAAGTAPPTALQVSPASSTLFTGRALILGLSAAPSEAPVNVLLLVDERHHGAFAPMRVEALVADRFVPIVVDDATRALGESGLLTMTFAVPPTPRELFGQTLTWLRFTPKRSAVGEWTPALRGAYLNAAWASARETLTRELLGSSDGAPNLTLRLARPPVLRNTLELRVREPLGEEERTALRDQNEENVLSSVDGLPGDWVLWKEVIDPDDQPATDRVYALDEKSGEIRFGDGRHGRIPPIGLNSIVAFRYCRTEADAAGDDSVPGNAVAARTTLNLNSSVPNVESVIAADQAAGGAPAESAERVLRFGFARLRHRRRAVTARDIEDLALQSSPDIVQARVLVRHRAIRLIVVMRGKDPRPNAAQVRELRRLLLEAGPASLGATDFLRIEGPKVRRLRVELQLLVKALDRAGALSVFVKQKLARFFDTATGGTDGAGWALGADPSEADIALAISGAPELESIADVARRVITDDGKAQVWPETLKATEIAMLADDPIRLQFETTEVMA